MVSASDTNRRRRALTAIAALAASPALAMVGSAQAQVMGRRMPRCPMSPPALNASRDTPATRGDGTRPRRPRPGMGIKGHGFVRDDRGHFATIDAPQAGAFTLVLG